MKQLLLSFAIAFACNAYGAIRTVSNNPSTIAHFSTIQAALDAAVSGDTIFVHGSPNAYAGFTVNNKSVTIIGPGWRPNKLLPHTASIVTGIQLSGTGTTGTELQGLVIASTVNTVTAGVNNIRFIRNKLTGNWFYITPGSSATISGYLFEGNWFDNGGVITNQNFTLENFIFQNNIFYESGCCISSNISGFTNAVNVLFDHNLFYGPSTGPRDAFGANSRFLILSNNIFVRRNAANNLSSSIFNNNITFNTGNDAPWNVNSNVNSGGNIAGQDPQMVDQAAVNAGTNDPLLNFSIPAGPANNAGTDGKDLGLLYDATGSLNWDNSRASRLPFIYSMNITTPTVAPGGNVTVTVESRRNN
ncbi:MAG TPA: hypothetical protein VD996_16700 [Chitinophagaceae bacterium]|nr:hypothetical protein [Chitinophagaceae bacterium]